MFLTAKTLAVVTLGVVAATVKAAPMIGADDLAKLASQSGGGVHTITESVGSGSLLHTFTTDSGRMHFNIKPTAAHSEDYQPPAHLRTKEQLEQNLHYLWQNKAEMGYAKWRAASQEHTKAADWFRANNKAGE